MKTKDELTRMDTKASAIDSRTAPTDTDDYPRTMGPWSVRRAVCRHDHPDTSADVHGVNGEFVADCGCHDKATANATLIAAAPELLWALKETWRVLHAAGLLHLSNGVQLGQTVWFVKASDAQHLSELAIAKAEGR